MRAIIYSEFPLNPLSISRHQLISSLAYEKHKWIFKTSSQDTSISLFKYEEIAENSDVLIAIEENANLDELLLDVRFNKPLSFTMLYETPISSITHKNREIETSLMGRFFTRMQNPVYLVFSQNLIKPFNSYPQTSQQLIETILQQKWIGNSKPGLIKIPNLETFYRTVTHIGIKNYTNLYLLSSSLAEETIYSRYRELFLNLTQSINPYVNYADFHDLVCQCDWIMTSHNLVNNIIPFCFYSFDDLKSTFQEICQQNNIITLLEVNQLPELVNFVDDAEKYLSHQVKVSDVLELSSEVIYKTTELKLDFKKITNIQELSQFKLLKSLNLDGNYIIDFSPLLNIPNLKSLSLKQVQLDNLDILSQLNLEKLSLTRNPFSGLSDLLKLKTLKSLCLENVKFNDIISINFPNSLEYLCLNHTNIDDLRVTNKLTSLEYLSINCLSIKELDALTNLENLKILIAEGLTEITNWHILNHLVRLQKISLSGSNFSNLDCISSLVNLETLDLSSTEIESVDLITNFSLLRELYLDGTAIQNFTQIRLLSNLEILWLGFSSLSNSDLYWISELDKLQELNISYTLITQLDLIQDKSKLTYLDLAGNNIEDFSKITNLDKLLTLNVSSCNIQDISWLQKLSRLKVLNLSENHIENIDFLRYLPQLEEMDIHDNPVNSIVTIANMYHLRNLDLSFTLVKDLSSLKNLTNLEVLNIKNTLVEDISVIINFPNLKILNLQNTQIIDFSPLFHIPKLQKLFLKVSGMKSDVYELLEKYHQVIPEFDSY